MRILHLITRMDRGGSAANTLACALAQQRAGHAVHLAMGPSVESSMSVGEKTAVAEGLTVFRDAGGTVHELANLLRRLGVHDLRARRDIRSLIRAVRPDVVHTHTSKAGALGRLAAWGQVKAVVHTPHGHVFHGYFGAAKTRLFVQAERLLARRCHALVALTTAECDEHLRFRIGTPQQWHVIPSGVPVTHLAAAVARCRAEAGDVSPVWQAMSVGRLVPIKGMDRLLRAWAYVQTEQPGAKLAIVGDGPERASLEGLIGELGLADSVELAGWQDPVPYLAAADRFVLLSRNEGMGRAVVEAMAAGLPCVVSRVCGLAELVDVSVGAVVDADDALAVAQALLRPWNDGVRERARARADGYATEVMVERLEVLYRDLTT
jgi:glycosyltransferase involved in cell wall biosynthesis